MIILRQKSYNLVGDLRHSGIKRTTIKYIGRGRKFVAGKIGKSIQRNRTNANIAAINSREIDKTINLPEINRKLADIAENNGAYVVFDGLRPANIPSNTAKSLDFNSILGKTSGEKANQASKLGRDIILYPKDSGTGALAHEIGHTKSKNSILRKISQVGTTRLGLIKAVRGIEDSSSGLLCSIKRAIQSGSITAEEILANKEAVNILNKLNISKSDLERIKRSYKLAETNYKNSSKAYYKMPLYNKIQIPSRRGSI